MILNRSTNGKGSSGLIEIDKPSDRRKDDSVVRRVDDFELRVAQLKSKETLYRQKRQAGETADSGPYREDSSLPQRGQIAPDPSILNVKAHEHGSDDNPVPLLGSKLVRTGCICAIALGLFVFLLPNTSMWKVALAGLAILAGWIAMIAVGLDSPRSKRG